MKRGQPCARHSACHPPYLWLLQAHRKNTFRALAKPFVVPEIQFNEVSALQQILGICASSPAAAIYLACDQLGTEDLIQGVFKVTREPLHLSSDSDLIESTFANKDCHQ